MVEEERCQAVAAEDVCWGWPYLWWWRMFVGQWAVVDKICAVTTENRRWIMVEEEKTWVVAEEYSYQGALGGHHKDHDGWILFLFLE